MKTPYQLFFCLVLTSIFAPLAPAKPLSYVGGTMVMQENDETGNTLTVDYTFNPHFALALYAKRDIGGKEFYTIGPQLNTLIKRWNLPNGQGNIFSMTGAGTSRQGSNSQPAAWAALLADYETRRLFLSYEPRLMYAEAIETSFWQRAHVGFAPYLADYDQLNSWLLLRFDHHPAKEGHFVVTPMVRFFYKTIWLEAGYSSNNHLMLNWALQF
jgi:hypothetical protein